MGELVEIPQDFLNGTQLKLGQHLIGFATISLSGRDEDAQAAGSGTLVEFGTKRAILTAHHVLSNLPDRGDIGLVLASVPAHRAHRLTIKAEHCNKAFLGELGGAAGPDLGCLILNEHDAATINAYRVFYNLGRRRDEVLKNPRDNTHGVWLLAGLIHERTRDATSPEGFSRVKEFWHVVNDGKVLSETTRDGFDYLEVEVKCGEQSPLSYEGTSGGGLWHILLGRNDDKSLKVREYLLSGVAFYQSEFKDGRRRILCHGRKSIYHVTCDALAAFET